MATRRVVVEHRKTGEQYAVTPAAFRSHYEDKGFKTVSWEGGEAYDSQPERTADTEGSAEPAPTADARARRAARARERRAARRAAAQQE